MEKELNFSDAVYESIKRGIQIKKIIPSTNETSAGIICGITPDRKDYRCGLLKEKRGIVNIDLKGSTKQSMVEQALKVFLLYKIIQEVLNDISTKNSPERLIPTGDGVYLIFGNGHDPMGGIKAVAFLTHFLSAVTEHNKTACTQEASLYAAASVTWGDVIPVKDIESKNNFIGDAINRCARINACRIRKELLPNEFLICKELFGLLSYPQRDNGLSILADNEFKKQFGLTLIGEITPCGEQKVKNWRGNVYKVSILRKKRRRT